MQDSGLWGCGVVGWWGGGVVGWWGGGVVVLWVVGMWGYRVVGFWRCFFVSKIPTSLGLWGVAAALARYFGLAGVLLA